MAAKHTRDDLFDIAERFSGMKELAGDADDNPMILAFLKLDADWPEHDEVPWCSGFVNFIAWICRAPRSKSLRARSWLEVGRRIRIDQAEPGDVVIFNRGGSPDPTVIKSKGQGLTLQARRPPGRSEDLVMPKFSEASTVSQVSQLLGLVAVMMTIFGAAFIALADQQIDQKYATDEDLAAVQAQVVTQVETITTTVQENTKVVRATSNSVDGLALVVLGLQISELEEVIIDLEAEKRKDGAAWNERDERNLRDRQRALSSLEIQRTALLERLVAGPDE